MNENFIIICTSSKSFLLKSDSIEFKTLETVYNNSKEQVNKICHLFELQGHTNI